MLKSYEIKQIYTLGSRRFEWLTQCLGVFPLHRESQFYSWSNQEYTTTIADKRYLNNYIEYHSSWERIEHLTCVVSGIDCIYICKDNYHTLMATRAYLKERNKYMKVNKRTLVTPCIHVYVVSLYSFWYNHCVVRFSSFFC